MIQIHDILAHKYQIISTLGKGGMSNVYLAKDLHMSTFWAIKEVMKNGDVYENSLRMEANLILKLDHPALPRIVDIFEDETTICLVMDYIEGKNLNEIQVQREDVVLDWAQQICKALAYLHKQEPPIIYRDMKPENVMVKADGTIKIIDFGTARTYKENKKKDTVILGTRGYAPWEQYTNQTDARSDIYALGMTMYFMLTHKHPHTFDRNQSFCREDVKNIICKCVEMDPMDRFQNCEQLLQALEHPQQIHKKNPKRTWTICTCLCLCASLTCFGLDFYFHQKQYEVLISLAPATSINQKIQSYTKAIQLYPYREEAYEKLLQVFEADGIFSKEESDIFLSMYNANHDKLKSLSLNDHVGRMYLNYDPSSFAMRIIKASSFFEENHDKDPENKMSQAYYEICMFYKKYIFQSVYVDEASQKEYEQLLKQIQQTIQQLKTESVFNQLTYQKTVLLFLIDQKESMKQVGISPARIETYMKEIIDQARSFKVHKPTSKSLQKEILELEEIQNDDFKN